MKVIKTETKELEITRSPSGGIFIEISNSDADSDPGKYINIQLTKDQVQMMLDELKYLIIQMQ